MIERLNELLQRAESSPTAELLDFAVGCYKEASSYIEAIEAIQKQAKRLIIDTINQTGEVEVIVSAGKVYRTAQRVSVRYDYRALDALMASNDNLRRILEPHRFETITHEGITIR